MANQGAKLIEVRAGLDSITRFEHCLKILREKEQTVKDVRIAATICAFLVQVIRPTGVVIC